MDLEELDVPVGIIEFTRTMKAMSPQENSVFAMAFLEFVIAVENLTLC